METKTKWAALWAYLAGIGGLGFLNWVTGANLIAGFPDAIEAILAPIVPVLAVLIAGYTAKHRPASLSDSALAAARARGVPTARQP